MSPPTPLLRVDVLTLFPDLFQGFLGESILKRAIAKGLVDVRLWDLRDWAEGKHRQVDDRPFGGGPGMVLMAPPMVAAVEALRAMADAGGPGRLIAMTPQGRTLTQETVRTLAREPRLVLLCGRYEGFDERIFEILEPELISIGDYVLSGGEVAAMVVIDAVMRLIPGVLGDAESAVDESFGPDGGLEYPHYTRPRTYRDRAVPEILLNGDHAAIERWRRDQARGRTAERRRDLLHPPQDTRLEPPGEPGPPEPGGRKEVVSHAE
ncbi:tRNA (guanosine(37)-N1)-methyltransferase TrmD [Tundrisphaera sp. TA3]|uniref:tRNA (guanosine(37)-N1)-methyltransferase TrmD n=1 Tax=Tundrisphaera sp. TA3 TaxID=3435775 RepID=UPI003EBE3C97